MERTYIKPPRTMMEVFRFLPEGTLVQLINNQLFLYSSHTDEHQSIVGKISVQLGNFVEKSNNGRLLLGPFDVYLNNRNAFQPDFLFAFTENLHKIKQDGFYGAPDLIIEVLENSTWRLDKEDKRDEYERSGVSEYWMVDPTDKSTEGFHLVEGEFQPLPAEPGTITFRLFECTITF